MTLRPFFCRIGSKRRLVKILLPYFPDHTVYVEPFVGGGAMFWTKEPSPTEVINDLDTNLIQGYKTLQTIKERSFPPASTFSTDAKVRHFEESAPNTKVNKFIKFLLRTCNTFGNSGKGEVYAKGNPYNKLKKIDEYQERLKGVKIYNKSYEAMIKQFDGPNTFFYLDPPYEKSKGLYEEHSMDYEAMRSLLDKVKGKWLLSINDSPEIRRIFKGYWYKSVKLPSVGGVGVGQQPRRELIIANYQN